jgi:diguanylate cyclase (GGDEF)-like protein/PAS domain S-box-containing protein
MSPNTILLYLTCATVISLTIGVYAWRNRGARGARAFAVLNFVTIVWILGDIVNRLNDTYTGQWIGESIRYLGGVSMPVALLVFVYQYCGRPVSRRTVFLIAILPAISWLLMVTNDLHHLFFASAEVGYPNPLHVNFGIYFWAVHLPYLYGLMLASMGKIVVEISRVSRHSRTPIVILFVALMVPFVINILGIAGVFGRMSYSPMSFPVAFVLIALAIFRFKFLRSNPIAYETVFQTIKDGVLILDPQGTIMDINAAGARRLHKPPKDLIGLGIGDAFANSPELLASYEGQKRLTEDIHATVASAERYLSLDITRLEDPDGTLAGRIVMLRDVTDRKQQEMSLSVMAFHDPLTRLANRRKFEEEVEIAIRESSASGKNFALLFMDLDRFKIVNDTMGHDVGDELLKYVAARIASILRKPDILARIGGDEFAILLHNSNELGVERVVERMMENVQRPFNVGEYTLTVGLSIGAAFYPADGSDLTQLLRHADAAMYRAKSRGGGLTLYSPGSEMEN